MNVQQIKEMNDTLENLEYLTKMELISLIDTWCKIEKSEDNSYIDPHRPQTQASYESFKNTPISRFIWDLRNRLQAVKHGADVLVKEAKKEAKKESKDAT